MSEMILGRPLSVEHTKIHKTLRELEKASSKPLWYVAFTEKYLDYAICTCVELKAAYTVLHNVYRLKYPELPEKTDLEHVTPFMIIQNFQKIIPANSVLNSSTKSVDELSPKTAI